MSELPRHKGCHCSCRTFFWRLVVVLIATFLVLALTSCRPPTAPVDTGQANSTGEIMYVDPNEDPEHFLNRFLSDDQPMEVEQAVKIAEVLVGELEKSTKLLGEKIVTMEKLIGTLITYSMKHGEQKEVKSILWEWFESLSKELKDKK